MTRGSHSYLEIFFGFNKHVLLTAIPLFGASAAIFLEKDNGKRIFQNQVDWWTLFFFIALFIAVGALKKVGIITAISVILTNISHNQDTLFMLLLEPGAILSGFLENIAIVTIFISIVQEIQITLQTPTDCLWWAILFGGTFGGNLTIVGSTANVIALGMMEKQGFNHISFWQWFKTGSLVTVTTTVTTFIIFYFQLL